MKLQVPSAGSVKSFLLAHGEKIGIAVAGIFAAVLIVRAIGHDRLEASRQPDDLESLITQSRSTIQGFDFNEAPAEAVRRAEVSENSNPKNVRPEAYQISSTGWDRPAIPPTVLRTDPELLAVEDLRGRGINALVPFRDDAYREMRRQQEQVEQQRLRAQDAARADREQTQAAAMPPGADRRLARERETNTPVDDRRQASALVSPPGYAPQKNYELYRQVHTAVVVGKVPIEAQTKRYLEVLENAKGYDEYGDLPWYLGYEVQRAEIRPGEEATWTNVRIQDGKGTYLGTAFQASTLDAVRQNWQMEPLDVVDQKYLYEPLLAFPIPPLVGRDWAEEATHPDIPLASQEARPDALVEDSGDSQEVTPLEEFRLSDPLGGAGRSASRRTQPRSGGGSGMSAEERFKQQLEQETMSRTANAGGRRRTGGARLQQGPILPEVPYTLFRFIDFSVEPGKKYKYRVRLALADVNYPDERPGFKSNLDNTVLERLERDAAEGQAGLRLTAWSEESEVIGIPYPGRVAVASANPSDGRQLTSEPSVEVLLESIEIDEQEGEPYLASLEWTLSRGSVANAQPRRTEALVDGWNLIDELDDYLFRTGVTVLDIRGGEDISGDYSAPARTVLLDSTGQLSVRSSTDDKARVQLLRDLFAESTSSSSTSRGGARPEEIPPELRMQRPP